MSKLTIILIIAVTLATCGALVHYMHLDEQYVTILGGSVGEKYYGMEDDSDQKGKKAEKKIVEFDLVDPECAPEDMLSKIMYGYHLMLETKKHAPEYAGNKIDCNNCHFNGGNTLGGKNRGISLVGVSAMYPKFSKRDNKTISLPDRINNCFRRSLNGKAPPNDSLEMESLLAYLAWISHEVMDAPMLPWLGLDPISSKHVPDAKAGELVYQQNCSSCHGENGEGYLDEIPPLWGNQSYNDGAGMNTLTMLSSFVWQNMPHGQPELTPEEALDVSAFIISRPRPHFTP